MKKGDILVYTSWNLKSEIYKIIKMTEKTVTVVELEKEIVEKEQQTALFRCNKVMPSDKMIGVPFRRKIGENETVKVGKNKYAKIWDGKLIFDRFI